MISHIMSSCINLLVLSIVLQFIFWSKQELDYLDSQIASLQQSYILASIFRKNINYCGYLGPYTYLLSNNSKIQAIKHEELHTLEPKILQALYTKKMKPNTTILLLSLVAKKEIMLEEDFTINSTNIHLPNYTLYPEQMLTIFDQQQAIQFKVLDEQNKKNKSYKITIWPAKSLFITDYIFRKSNTTIIVSEPVLFYVAQATLNKYSLYRHDLNGRTAPQAILDLVETFDVTFNKNIAKINLSFKRTWHGNSKNINKKISFTTYATSLCL